MKMLAAIRDALVYLVVFGVFATVVFFLAVYGIGRV